MFATTSSADADAAEPVDRAAAWAAVGMDNAVTARAAEVVMTWRRVKPVELGIELSIESKGLPHVEGVIVEALRHGAGA
jgi:hydrogenase/urease accessory protein HupE